MFFVCENEKSEMKMCCTVAECGKRNWECLMTRRTTVCNLFPVRNHQTEAKVQLGMRVSAKCVNALKTCVR